ncbi:MAG: 50S ribosomal protein L21 [Ruminococcaceae bacterium]|nr:50S ribosomal protein L21 [Oscillospiraceae bacterium]
MYAVIETGGKQYQVAKEDVIYIEKLNLNEGDEIVFDKVLVATDSKNKVKIGNPYVEGASVKGKVIKNGKSKKITVFTYRPKKDSKRKMGHRQQFTKVLIENIEF